MSHNIKNFFSSLDEIVSIHQNKEIIVFLDYDGTLTPIVDTPDLAILSSDMKECVQKLADSFKVAIVSGRATDDVMKKVRIDQIYYAGSHGFEIVDPNGNVHINPEVEKIRTDIVKIYNELTNLLDSVNGALVEDVKYTVSVHYRLVSDEDVAKVEEAVLSVLSKFDQFIKTEGKKVFEIRPKIDWHKGKAVNWILNELQFDQAKNIAIYLGDDTTDEDAFAEVENKGFGILVSEAEKPTKAKYKINDTDDVKKVLEYFNQ